MTISVLLADDDPSLRLVLGEALSRAGFRLTTAASLAEIDQALAADAKPIPEVLVTDMLFPDGNALDRIADLSVRRPNLAIIVMSAQATLLTAIKTQQQAAVDAYLPKPFPLDSLIACIKNCTSKSNGSKAKPKSPAASPDASPIIGKSPAMQEIYRSIARLVATDMTVMITGESGTGKELVARALHNLGHRRDSPFIAINMAAIPQELIEAELFGHERGAFTGAEARKIGRFEEASGGTLFLDEIGDMPLVAQTRLLRVLQDGVFTRIGGQKPIKTNARIISATHKDMPTMLADGAFREDLFYRLNVVPLHIPPLRERSDDIPELTAHLLAKAAGTGLPAKPLTTAAMQCLQDYHWPGNVRELENLLRRLLLLVDDKAIDASHVQAHLSAAAAQSQDFSAQLTELADKLVAHNMAAGGGAVYGETLAAVEKALITAALAATNGNQIKAADLLGINRNTLRKKMAGLGIANNG